MIGTMRWIFFLTLVGCVPRWTRAEIAMQVTSAAVQVVDWQQTTRITGDCREGNPIIGMCGERTPTMVFFPLVFIGRLLLADALPHKWRAVFIGATTGYQADAVMTNWEAGYVPMSSSRPMSVE